MKYKKSLLVLFLVLESIFFYGIERPVLKSGVRSYSYFKLLEYEKSLYPSTLTDNMFFSVSEKFSDSFKFKNKIDLQYSNYNKCSDNLSKLQAFIFKNTLNLYFDINPINHIAFSTKPMMYYQYGETYFKLMNKLQYKLSLKYFMFKTYYSHQFAVRDDELFYHNINLSFYWRIPKADFVKIKTSATIYLQHNFNKVEEKVDDDLSILKSARINFEVAIDFNKIDFEEIFEKDYKEDEDFFEF